ncbi:hypothetical protein QTP70_010360 [Hemibagrus guttatus]|uniref:Uncharacterized protein n=1 Tax=Hemibagrus guttatus TaxID=175788 RepID=A0AAE0V268_9TELE|nr:hypothetical protein QTP70_010360 [Hemibagrus guttatus]
MGKRKDLSEFDKGQIVMARRLDQSISKTAALVGSSRSAVFGDDPFLFQHDCTSVHKAMSDFGVEELDWPAQSPDLNIFGMY